MSASTAISMRNEGLCQLESNENQRISAIRAPTISWEYLSLVHALEDQGAVGTAKAKAVGDSVLDIVLLRLIWY